ncbi:MAG: class I SAM-dependent methyltransferase [Geminicoccaceae bacterium]|nr:MAG: class I SAM-dependent methyltransferase [Geminicoccaceae bacterium]
MTDANVTVGRAGNRTGAGWGGPSMRVLAAMCGRLTHGRLTVRAPDGSQRVFEGAKGAGFQAELHVHQPRLAMRVLRGGALGFAEAYLDGDCDTPDLTALLKLLLANGDDLAYEWQGKPWVRAIKRLYHRLHPNSKRGAKRNIHAHYDLGNAFYGLWLDPSMTYSAALFRQTDDLEAAQLEKYRQLARLLHLEPGQHVLEVGCGWGGFAEVAAREFGCRVTGVTISEEQFAYARRRMAEAGLAEQVDIRFQDYRDIEGRFDAIASIEMFEAVGEAYWPTYFRCLHERLDRGGRAGLQVITIADRYFEDYRQGIDFIQRYVFPGGMLPSPTRLREEAERCGLALERAVTFGQDYARTLRLWGERFARAWPEIQPLGFDERFRRTWSYYLAYCEAGFSLGSIDVEQVVFRRLA